MTLAVRFGLEETRVLEHSLLAQAYKCQGVNNIQTSTLAISKGGNLDINRLKQDDIISHVRILLSFLKI